MGYTSNLVVEYCVYVFIVVLNLTGIALYVSLKDNILQRLLLKFVQIKNQESIPVTVRIVILSLGYKVVESNSSFFIIFFLGLAPVEFTWPKAQSVQKRRKSCRTNDGLSQESTDISPLLYWIFQGC